MSFHRDQTLLQEAIIANADNHARLCATISDLTYVHSFKEEQAALIGDLKEKLARGNERLVELSNQTAREKKEYESLRDPKGRQFVHRIVGRKEMFERKQKKEEREYVEALEVQTKERENCQTLKTQLDQAEEQILKLDKKKKVHDAAVSERDELYCSVLMVPWEQTPSKDALLKAQYIFNDMQQSLDNEHKASEYLSQAVQKTSMCENYIFEAQNNSGYEMWPVVVNAFAKVQEAIKNAQATAAQVTALVEAAMRLCTIVVPVGDIEIHENALLSGLTFSTFLTDLKFFAKLNEAKTRIVQIRDRLTRQQGAVSSRAIHTARSLKEAADKVDECRDTLTELRKTIFNKYGVLPRYDNEVLAKTLCM